MKLHRSGRSPRPARWKLRIEQLQEGDALSRGGITAGKFERLGASTWNEGSWDNSVLWNSTPLKLFPGSANESGLFCAPLFEVQSNGSTQNSPGARSRCVDRAWPVGGDFLDDQFASILEGDGHSAVFVDATLMSVGVPKSDAHPNNSGGEATHCEVKPSVDVAGHVERR